MNKPDYDPKVFEELEEKLNDITEYCLRNQIPIFMTYAKENGESTDYENHVVTPINVDVKLTDDRITKYNASLNENLVLKFKQTKPVTFAGDVFDSMME